MSGYYQRKIINFFCYWSHSGVKMESIGNTNVFVTIVLVTHITISNQLSRFQILVLCGMEFSYITFYLFFGNIDKMQDSHFEIWHPYCIHLVWLWQDNSQSLTNHSVRISIIMWAIILSWIKLRKRSCNLSAQHCLCLFWSL